MVDIQISDRAFSQLKAFIYDSAGIHLGDGKKALVSMRLAKRLRARDVATYDEYFKLLSLAAEARERQVAIDLLTTNETYFFREPKHFEFLARLVAARTRDHRPFRVWSAASSTGEEAYSIAMLLADKLGPRAWEIFASDISTRVLETARRGCYPMERAANTPRDYLRRFCLKGTGPEDGMLMVDPALQERVTFAQVNLSKPLPDVGMFDVILLRNVMIYFDQPTKRAVLHRLVDHLAEDGYLLIGHSETLNGVDSTLIPEAPSIYRMPRRH